MATIVTLILSTTPALARGAPGCVNDAAVRSRDVVFKNGAGRLSGMIVGPSAPGRHPAILFLYGSSTATRDGRGLFPPLWCALAREGVVTLSWDRPGAGQSTGDAQALDWLAGDRATEAQAALSFARAQPEIDPRDVGLLGISQAGWVIPQILRRDPALARLVMLSSPVGTVWDQTRYIVDRHLELQGHSAANRDEARLALAGIEAFLHAEQGYDAYRRLVAGFASKSWLADVKQLPQGDYFALSAADFALERRDAARDRPTDLAAVTMPVLAVYGDRDLNVDPIAGIAAFAALRASNPRVAIVVIPGVDHFMRHAPAEWPRDRPAAIPSLQSLAAATVAPELIAVLRGWASETER